MHRWHIQSYTHTELKRYARPWLPWKDWKARKQNSVGWLIEIRLNQDLPSTTALMVVIATVSQGLRNAHRYSLWDGKSTNWNVRRRWALMNRCLILRTGRGQLPPVLMSAHFTRRTGSPPRTSPDITSISSAVQAQCTFQELSCFLSYIPEMSIFTLSVLFMNFTLMPQPCLMQPCCQILIWISFLNPRCSQRLPVALPQFWNTAVALDGTWIPLRKTAQMDAESNWEMGTYLCKVLHTQTALLF